MRRRSFIRNIALGSLALKVSPKILGAQAKAPDMAYVQGESPVEITKEAVRILGGMKRFVSRGDVVIVKPNIGWDRTPEMAANSNPDVVRAVVELALEAGAKEVKVMDNTTNQAKRCYIRSGIQDAAKAAGAKVLFTDEHRLKKTALKGEWLKDWEVFADFIEADKLINVPIAKVHSLTRLSMGMKNWLGALGGARNQLHQKLDQAMVDLAAFFKPALTVIDAYRILVRNGPQGGRISDTKLLKTVVASTDYVAADAMGATFFDVKPTDLLYLKIAQEKGLGKHELEKLTIEKRTV
jgi:uncharacterized protein (DUF362 family)